MLGDIRQAQKVYIVCGYTDMRKGLNSLVPFVQQNFRSDGCARDGSLCDAGEVSERRDAVSPGGLLEGLGCGNAAQYDGQLGDSQRPLVQVVV